MKKLLTSALAIVFSCSVLAEDACYSWPHWNSFKQNFISEQGRVIDLGSEKNITTSEGQSYALFFALVANDKAMFDKLLGWTEKNLSEGDLSARLPAWLWGRQNDKEYGILDSNPASDSDIWIAYSLLEASRLWQERRYAVLASVMAKRILREETERLPGLGLTLLPAPYGFALENETWRLNPSYAPLQLLRRFVDAYPNSPWQEVHDSAYEVLLKSAPKGFAPDWVLYSPSKGFHFSKKHNDEGNFNAIRVYLWAALMDPGAQYASELIRRYEPMAKAIAKNGYTPLNVYASSGKFDKRGPVGFDAAMLQFLDISYETGAFINLKQHVDSKIEGELTKNYYSSVLSLFGTGAINKRFSFLMDGKLQTQWEQQCQN